MSKCLMMLDNSVHATVVLQMRMKDGVDSPGESSVVSTSCHEMLLSYTMLSHPYRSDNYDIN